MSHRNLLGLLANPPRFLTLLETELGANCADPRGGSRFGRMAEQSPLTGCEPDSLIEISSEYTPISFLPRRNSFNTDFNSVPTTSAASDVADFHDERQLIYPTVHTGNRSKCESLQFLCPSTSSSKRQPAAASILKCHNSVANVECWELLDTAAKW